MPSQEDPAFAEAEVVGKVFAEVELTNTDDEALHRNGHLSTEGIRKIRIQALVDTGATLLIVPPEEIQKLGLPLFREATTRFANGQTSIRKIYGPVKIKVMNRLDLVAVMAGHPGMPALLGQIPLEGLDLMVDSKRQRLVPGHPESPDVQMVECY